MTRAGHRDAASITEGSGAFPELAGQMFAARQAEIRSDGGGQVARPQHFLYLRPEPHQHGALRSGGQAMVSLSGKLWL